MTKRHHKAGFVLASALALLAWCWGCALPAPTFAAVAATAPATAPASAPATAPAVRWRPAFRGVDLAHVDAASPRPMRIDVARIDLKAPGLRFLATPPAAEGPRQVKSLKVSSFLALYKCQLAINTSPYADVCDEEGVPQTVLGLAVSNGKVYGTPTPAYGAVAITKDNRVVISRPPYDMASVHNAAGGFTMVLEAGKNVGESNSLHPRTGAGVSKDGRYLYLIAIDGRQPAVSEGATTSELADWLEHMGAWDGLNFDGGGSTALVIEGPDGKPRVLNQPIHKGVPGNERPVANHLGVFAEPLEAH